MPLRTERVRAYSRRTVCPRGNSLMITIPKATEHTDFPYEPGTQLEPELREREGEPPELVYTPIND